MPPWSYPPTTSRSICPQIRPKLLLRRFAPHATCAGTGRGQLTQRVVMDVVKELGHYRGMSMRRALGHSSGAGATNANQRDDADARMMFAIMDRSGDGVIDEVRLLAHLPSLAHTLAYALCQRVFYADDACVQTMLACMHGGRPSLAPSATRCASRSARRTATRGSSAAARRSRARAACAASTAPSARRTRARRNRTIPAAPSRLWPCRPPHMNMGLICVWFPRYFSPPRYFDVALDGLLLLNAVALIAEDFNLLESGSDNTDLDGVPGARQYTPTAVSNARPPHARRMPNRGGSNRSTCTRNARPSHAQRAPFVRHHTRLRLGRLVLERPRALLHGRLLRRDVPQADGARMGRVHGAAAHTHACTPTLACLCAPTLACLE